MIRCRSPATEVVLCLETPQVWRMVGGPAGRLRGRRFRCNCGPLAIPALAG
jgi:hypothetical protein